jgi:hypothetical protein
VSANETPELADSVGATLAEHLAQNGGGFVTSWHLVANLIDGNGEQSWLYATAPDQLQIQTLGLLEWSRGVAHHDQRRYLEGLHDD